MNGCESIEMPASPRATDEDYETNLTLSARKLSWSRRQLNKVAHFFESKSPRENISVSTFRNSEIQRWKIQAAENGRSEMECLKVTNPTVLGKMTMSTTRNIKTLTIEDSDGLLTELPLNLNLLYPLFIKFKLTWSRVRTLPSSLFHSALKELDLTENLIISINGIESARCLGKLILRNNCLQMLPDDIGCLNNLLELDVSQNKLKELPNSIGSLQTIERLDVSQNKIKFLPDSLSNLKRLKFLNVSCNHLENLNSSMSHLFSLEDLQASNNQLSSLPYSFESLASLKSILLSRNSFRSLPSCLSSLPQLDMLNLNGNRLQLSSDRLASVRILNLDNNQLTEIPKSLMESLNIEHLSLRGNQLISVAEEISSMKSLTSLHLTNNEQLRRLPTSMTAMTSLKHLFIQRTLVQPTDKVVQDLSSTVFIHFESETVGPEGVEKKGENSDVRSVGHEMLKICRFCSLHLSGSCRCMTRGTIV